MRRLGIGTAILALGIGVATMSSSAHAQCTASGAPASCGVPGSVSLTAGRDHESCETRTKRRFHFWVPLFAPDPFHIRIGRGSKVTVIDFESLPETTSVGTGVRGTRGSLSSERSNCRV